MPKAEIEGKTLLGCSKLGVMQVLQRGITLFAFDFAGCGLSEGPKPSSQAPNLLFGGP